jgi:hypothetical protein
MEGLGVAPGKAVTASQAPQPDRLYRWAVTPTCRHMFSTGHVEHFGAVPVQTCFPNGTSRALISTQ